MHAREVVQAGGRVAQRGKHVGRELIWACSGQTYAHVVCLARNPVEHVLCDGCVRVNQHTTILPGRTDSLTCLVVGGKSSVKGFTDGIHNLSRYRINTLGYQLVHQIADKFGVFAGCKIEESFKI